MKKQFAVAWIVFTHFFVGICAHCCPDNEVYSECGNNGCQNTCANPNIGKVCKAACNPGCICREGYLRNTKNICVPAAKCDTCGQNEIFDLCGNTPCVNTCAEPDRFIRCTSEGCNAGCICVEGYLRNADKKCVKPEQCEESGCRGDPNAVFDPCGDNCPVTCENKDDKVARICTAVCLTDGGCRCKEGFVLDHNGKCIQPSQCVICKGINEFFSCGSACDTTCATLGEPCPIVNIKCTEMCYCRDGFARDASGVCIPVNECPERECPDDPNAIIVPCGDPCPLTCDNKDETQPRPCPFICINNGCKCKDGYVLGKEGKCILARNCPPTTVIPAECEPGYVKNNNGDCVLQDNPSTSSKCRKNEVYYECPSPCPPESTCSSYFIGVEPLCPTVIPKPEDCKPAWRCKPNYVRNDEGDCVLPEECCADPNSELVSCPNPCFGGTCAHPEFNGCKMKCEKYGCQCKRGYLKISENDSTCIKQSRCPKASTDCDCNEIYSECGNNSCQNTCENPNVGKYCKPICTPGCICREGYLRNTDGVCVPPCKCDTCGSNEIFDLCGNTECVDTCAEPDLSTRCTPSGCNAGCICRDGYLRNEERICVKPENCVLGCGGDPHATFDPCGDTCPVTCENRNTCPKKCVEPCRKEGACRCINKYVRDYSGKCILPCECPTCDGPNEIFACGSACDTTCATLGETCPIINIKCNEMCYCKDGFARDINGICIPVDQCPIRECPSDNNAFIDPCGDPCPLTCENKDGPLLRPCPAICIVNGCRCKDGFVLNKDGKCVLTRDCPVVDPVIPTCLKFEVYSRCGNNACQNTCANPNVARICKADCHPGCICEEGYLRNTEGICVPAVECDTCTTNEIFDLCGNTGCVNTCAEPDLITRCTPAGCNAGCICKEGYLRNDQNLCVRPEECETSCGGDPNAVFDVCGDPCPVTCENRHDTSLMCTAVCQNGGGCKCKKGFVRSFDGKCILASQCDICTGKYEFFSCGSACDSTCSTLGEDCPIINKKCTEMCYCKDGYARNSEGICIPSEQCPERECPNDANAIILPCGDPCPITCENKDNPTPPPCPRICIRNGCKCKDGFVLNNDGKCVLTRDCTVIPTCSSKYEVYSSCGNNASQNTCANPNIALGCNAKCTPGCICVEGYLRNTMGMCVPAVECDTCTTNEIFDLCGNTGCVNTCAEPDLITRCTPAGCNAGCICKEGFLRNHHNLCVRPEECETSCGGDPNAVFDVCGDSCPVTCENRNEASRLCTVVCINGGGCKCKDGFVLNKDGKCVLTQDCPVDPICGEFEIYSICGNNACQNTCANPNIALGCEDECNPGCICAEGFLRNTMGICVPAVECDTCGANEFFDQCGNTDCVNTCIEPDRTSRCSPPACIPGCICLKGYLRNSHGVCTLPSDCPRLLECFENEIYEICSSPCLEDLTCASYFSGISPECLAPRDEPCQPACRCQSGYVRDSNSRCVLPEMCCTDPNSELVSCPNPCSGGTCATKQFASCDTQCPPYGCQCKSDYFKASATNTTCVSTTACQRIIRTSGRI